MGSFQGSTISQSAHFNVHRYKRRCDLVRYIFFFAPYSANFASDYTKLILHACPTFLAILIQNFADIVPLPGRYDGPTTRNVLIAEYLCIPVAGPQNGLGCSTISVSTGLNIHSLRWRLRLLWYPFSPSFSS